MTESALLVFLVALASCLALTPAVGWLCRRQGWLDLPDGERKLHTIPMPRLGGVAVYASLVLAFGCYAYFLPEEGWSVQNILDVYLPLLVACGAVMLVGVADDIRGVRPIVKIAVQAAAATYLYMHGHQIAIISNPLLGDPIELGWLSFPLTILWFVGLSNAFNLIDGLDGLAAGVALFATGTLYVAAVGNQRESAAVVIAALAGALLGFLRYNFNPATIFLGDSGSLFIGFALAAFSIRSSMKATTAIAVGAPLFALALPILDVGLAIARRFVAGYGIFHSDRRHIHHRLLYLGLTPRRAVMYLYGAAAVFGSIALVTTTGRDQVKWALAIGAGLVTWVAITKLGYVEFSQAGRILMKRLLPDRRVAANNIHIVELRETLQRAATVAQLWDTLAAVLPKLPIARVELRLAAPWDAIARTAMAEQPPNTPFPVLAHDQAAGDGCRLSWDLQLAGANGCVGRLLVSHTHATDLLELDLAGFLGVIQDDFGVGLVRLLGSVPLNEDRMPAVPVPSPQLRTTL